MILQLNQGGSGVSSVASGNDERSAEVWFVSCKCSAAAAANRVLTLCAIEARRRGKEGPVTSGSGAEEPAISGRPGQSNNDSVQLVGSSFVHSTARCFVYMYK